MEAEASMPHGEVLTIGHSNHPFETFVGLLKQHQVETVVDVRTSPYSRYAVHFNKRVIQRALPSQGIAYLFLGRHVGGMPADESFYDDQGYVLYDRLAESTKFQEGISRILNCAQSTCAALLCSEEDPTNCHRRLLVGRVLRERGVEVLHIRGDGRVQSEQAVADAEEFEKTRGQISLFETEEPEAWRSSQSVLPRKVPPNSSAPSGEQA